MNPQFGYIRVSSVDQNESRQLEGIQLDKKFIDKCSGKDTKRPELQRALEHLREGDTLHVHSIDRLARSLQDLQVIVKDLNAKGVTVKFHTENLTFTGDENPMQELMFQLMGAFAQFERAVIKERQKEGIAAAKKRGVYKGRAPKLAKEQIEEIRSKADAGANKAALAREYKVSRQTIYSVLTKA
ncbi:MAG: recombinase family protein [Pseudodesulfovibrio sp.]